jgi:O-antigen ligase
MALVGLVALGIGLLSAATSPLAVAGALFGLAALAAIWARPATGLLLFVAVVAVLPFGVIPVQVGVQLTLVDAVLIATYSALLVRASFGAREIGATGALLVGFVLVAVAAFGAGAAATPTPPELIRRFAKLVAATLFFLVAKRLLVSQVSRDLNSRLLRWLMVAGAIQGAIGAALFALPPTTQLSLLTSLAPLGYPTTDVLRYVPGPNDTYTSQLRATGTSIDPNVFGGTLMLALLLILVQLVAPRPVMGRFWLGLLGLPTLAGVVLSLSRASWVGLAAGLLVVGVLKYRRILVLGLLGLALLLALPVGQDLALRFVSGFSVADRATAFRVGEYANALTLIQRYPLLGIGFGASPDIDVTAGVSSVYLLVAEQTGLLGLGVYLTAVLGVAIGGIRRLRRPGEPRLDGLLAAFVAAVCGALVAGLLDHYFANQVFPHAVALFWLYAGALASGASGGERHDAATG